MYNPQKPAILQQQAPQVNPQTQQTQQSGSGTTRPGGATAYMRTDIVDSHQYGMSIPTLWEKSYLCPCRNRKTRQPEQACDTCKGRGIAFLPSKVVLMTVQSQEKGIINADLGLMDTGTAIGTPERSRKVSFRDRITIPEILISQSLIFDATQKRIDHGFYLIYNVEAIELAVTKERPLIMGEDFEFDFDKNLFIPKQHLLGQNISINILTQLRYMVVDLLKEHRYAKEMNDDIVQLPQKLLLKREDIFVDKEHFEDDNLDGQMIDTKRAPEDGLNGFFGGVR